MTLEERFHGRYLFPTACDDARLALIARILNANDG